MAGSGQGFIESSEVNYKPGFIRASWLWEEKPSGGPVSDFGLGLQDSGFDHLGELLVGCMLKVKRRLDGCHGVEALDVLLVKGESDRVT